MISIERIEKWMVINYRNHFEDGELNTNSLVDECADFFDLDINDVIDGHTLEDIAIVAADNLVNDGSLDVSDNGSYVLIKVD